MKKTSNRISFENLNDIINLNFNASDRMKKKRFKESLKQYLDYLKTIGYIYEYNINESKTCGYFGIQSIDINPLKKSES